MSDSVKSGKVVMAVLWFASLMALWELSALLLNNVLKVPYAETKLPFLHQVLIEMVNQRQTLLTQCGITFMNSIVGFALGALVGTGIAILMNAWKTMEHIIMPYAVASQMIPVIGLAPIVFGILHNPSLSRITISGYVTFLPVSISVLRGLKTVVPEQFELMEIYAASSVQVFSKVKWKSALPSLFTGLKLSAPLAVTAAILVELMGAPNGIGVLMVNSIYYGTSQIDMFWSTVIASVCVGLFSFLIIVALERVLTPWQPEFRTGKV